MTQLFNDRYKLSLAITVLFILGIGVSLYFVYSIPAALNLAQGYQPEFTKVYFTFGLTTVLGALAIIWTLRHTREVIVYRDREMTAQEAEREAAEQAGRTTISLDSVRNSIRQAKGQKDMLQAGLHAICKQLEAGQGALYVLKETEGVRKLELQTGYALSIGESKVISYEYGEGLIGQAAAANRSLYIDEVPEGYINILSGLGSASPRYLFIVPLKQQDQVKGVAEIASFTPYSEDQRKFVEEAAQLISEKITA